MTDHLNRVQMYVVSSTMTGPQWDDSAVPSGGPVEEVRALKDRPGRDIVGTGSSTRRHTPIAAGPVDEHHPVVQGRAGPSGVRPPPVIFR